MVWVIELGAYPGGLRPRSIFKNYYGTEDKDFHTNFENITVFDTKYAAERAVTEDLGYNVYFLNKTESYELEFIEISDEKLAKLYLQNDGNMVLSQYI